MIQDRDPGDETMYRCPVCGERYDADIGGCVAGCYCPDLDEEPDEEAE